MRHIKELRLEEAAVIYDTYLVCHFPAEEVKPFFKIEEMWKVGGYEVLGLFEDETMIAYAFLTLCPGSKVVLLDYYAVLDAYRGGGIGTFFLDKMKEIYGNKGILALMIETEDIEFAENEEQVAERVRRDGFYARNGVIKTPFTSLVYDANYRVWYLPAGELLTEEYCRLEYDKIYQFMLSEEGYREHFKITECRMDDTLATTPCVIS
ncbi:MAG: GNAT family N-acetyltransferase [Dorea sp.]|nr:GNAT family N-acetyltransferase [Dorea sp.]